MSPGIDTKEFGRLPDDLEFGDWHFSHNNNDRMTIVSSTFVRARGFAIQRYLHLESIGLLENIGDPMIITLERSAL